MKLSSFRESSGFAAGNTVWLPWTTDTFCRGVWFSGLDGCVCDRKAISVRQSDVTEQDRRLSFNCSRDHVTLLSEKTYTPLDESFC